MRLDRALMVGLALTAAAGAAPARAQSLYQSGMVRAEENLRSPLQPPEQPEGGEMWLVEPDIELYHFAEGSGRNVLVVHGGPGYPMRGPWPGLQPLTDGYRFHYYHQRGCGRSTRPVEKPSSGNYMKNVGEVDRALGLGAQIADVERIRRLLGEDRLILIGHSFGAFIAALYAAEFPEHVDALVLVSPAAVLVIPAENGGLFEWIKAALPEEMHEEYGRFLGEYFNFGTIFSRTDRDLADLNRRFARFYAAAAGTDSSGTDLDGIGGWVTHACFFSMGMTCDYRSALGQVRARSLVVHGGKDIQPKEASAAYVTALPKAELAVIEGAGHFPYEDKPEEFASTVGAFLRSETPD